MRKLSEDERQHLRNSINELLDSFDLLTSILPEGEQLDKAYKEILKTRIQCIEQ
jgi:hypothetical protein